MSPTPLIEVPSPVLLETKVYRIERPWLDELNIPGNTICKFTVTDPQSRYIDGLSWIETDPLCLDVYCKPEDAKSKTQYFLDLGCYIGNADDIIVPPISYKSVVVNPKGTESLLGLIEFGVTQYQPLKLFPRVLESVYNDRLVNSNLFTNIKAYGDAFCDFKDVKEIYVNGVVTDPNVFTKENPLVPEMWSIYSFVMSDYTDSMEFTSVMFTSDERQNRRVT